MKISNFVKSTVYIITAGILLFIGAYIQNRLYVNLTVQSYLKSEFFLFFFASGFLGTGIYSFISFRKKHREHIYDSVFLSLIGATLMIYTLATFISNGGMSENSFAANGLTPVNLNIVVFSLFFTPFLIRGLVLGLSRDNNKKQKRIAIILFSAIIILVIILIFTGNIMNMVRTIEKVSPKKYS